MRQLYEQKSEVIVFESRTEAEYSVTEPKEAGEERVVIQRAAPNDPSSGDAYVVYFSIHRKQTPAGSLESRWTFDTTASQYGAIGDALVTAPGIPAVKHFVTQDLAPYPSNEIKEKVRIDVLTDSRDFDWVTIRSAVSGERANWTPDCEIRVRYSGLPIAIHQYFCEIKPGDASFQRQQVQTMEAVPEITDVLKIRVLIDDLPTEYAVKFRRVGDDVQTIDWDMVRERIETRHLNQTGLPDFAEGESAS